MLDKVQLARTDDKFHPIDTIPVPGGILRYAGALGHAGIQRSGNNGSNTLVYPAALNLSNVISVANTNENDILATNSNFGSTVNLAAPGSNIVSTYFFGTTSLSGTSMAAPNVAATAALIWSINPNLSDSQVKGYILSNVDTVSTLNGKVTSGGRLNTSHAVREAAGYIMGDADLNGSITATDSRLVLRFSSQLENLTSLQKVLADVDL